MGPKAPNPRPPLARFVPNCANWSVGTAHWTQHTAQTQCVWYKLLRTVRPKTRSCPKDRPTIVRRPTTPGPFCGPKLRSHRRSTHQRVAPKNGRPNCTDGWHRQPGPTAQLVGAAPHPDLPMVQNLNSTVHLIVGCSICPLPSSPRPLFCPPNLAKPTALCTVAPKSFGTNFCVLRSLEPNSACYALSTVQFPTPFSKLQTPFRYS